jgi:hypothetical protein
MPLFTFSHSLLNVLVQIANKMGLQKYCVLDVGFEEDRSDFESW